jgi:hypothetical protein
MPKITISKDVFGRISEFRKVIEAVLEEEASPQACVETILIRGMDLMLAELLAPTGPEALLATIQQLGARHPAQVYGFIAGVLKTVMSPEQKQEVQRQMGFHAIHREDAGEQA